MDLNEITGRMRLTGYIETWVPDFSRAFTRSSSAILCDNKGWKSNDKNQS